MKKKYTLKIECDQTIGDTKNIKMNGKKIKHPELGRLLWQVLDMHRHNTSQYSDCNPTIEGAFSEIAEELITREK